MIKTRIFAMYLPQFHEIKENSEFWGEGFTDWVSVKKSTSLFKKHIQPKVPLDNFYYDLSKDEDVIWQCKLAKQYGIDGFGIYHYWFNNDKNLLTRPSEIILTHPEIDINYFFAWDNASWKRTWSKFDGNDWAPNQDASSTNETGILIPYILGTENEWEKHFSWLLKFFKDDRYEKRNNKPVFVIYNYSPDIEKMHEYWNFLAKNNGFEGIDIIYKHDKSRKIPRNNYVYYYEPLNSGWTGLYHKSIQKIKKTLKLPFVKKYSYDRIWRKIISNAKKEKNQNSIFGAFVNYDDTPRRGILGRCVVNGTPQKFYNYLKELYYISQYKNKDYIFVTAWNEWGEGAYLEPDNINKYGFLEKIKKIKDER